MLVIQLYCLTAVKNLEFWEKVESNLLCAGTRTWLQPTVTAQDCASQCVADRVRRHQWQPSTTHW